MSNCETTLQSQIVRLEPKSVSSEKQNEAKMTDVHDSDNKQRIYESMDGIKSELDGQTGERYVGHVELPSNPTEPRDGHGSVYANVRNSGHLYETLRDQEPFYVNAKAEVRDENPCEEEMYEEIPPEDQDRVMWMRLKVSFEWRIRCFILSIKSFEYFQ